MTDHIPGSFGEAMANLSARLERFGRKVREATRYVQADRHRLIHQDQQQKGTTMSDDLKVRLGNDIYAETGILHGPISEILDYLMSHGWLHDPNQVPGRTITESEVREGIEWAASRNFTVDGIVRECLRRAGYQVVPDPEPTNADKLVQLLKDVVPGSGGGISWESAAQKLDAAGVRAPGGDDDH